MNIDKSKLNNDEQQLIEELKQYNFDLSIFENLKHPNNTNVKKALDKLLLNDGSSNYYLNKRNELTNVLFKVSNIFEKTKNDQIIKFVSIIKYKLQCIIEYLNCAIEGSNLYIVPSSSSNWESCMWDFEDERGITRPTKKHSHDEEDVVGHGKSIV